MRVGFVVEKRSGFRRIYCYINGVMSGVVQYPADDDFSQVIPADITIGSSQCTMDLYCISVYDNDLTSKQMEDNWIADTQDGGLRRGTLDICLGRRYPDTKPPYTDSTQLAEFSSWMVSVDPEKATGDVLPEAVTIVDGEKSTTYTNDTAAYRKAKFRAELGGYVELDSALFYYLFTELFLMVDSRAKNMFPSFIGTDIS